MPQIPVPNEYELVNAIKSNDHARIERVRRVSDGTQWIRRIYADDKRELFRTLASVKDKHIPAIEEITFDDGTTIIEQEAPGVPLREYLLSKKLTRRQVVFISKQLLMVLAALHERAIIHRDIKPENILITPGDDIHLIDFGIARIYRPESTRDTSLFGTAGYAAPEQYGFSQTDYRSDLYSTGMLMKELCANANIKQEDRLFKIAEQCASFDPNRRCADSETALRQLEKSDRGPMTLIISIVLILGFCCLVGYQIWQGAQKITDPGISGISSEQNEVSVKLASISEEQNRMYLSITPKTRAKEIFYKLDSDTDFKSTGFLQHVDTVSGLNMPNATFWTNIAQTLAVQTKYIGLDDKEYGPFTTEVDVAKEALENVKRQLLAEHIPWITFHRGDLEGKLVELSTSVFATHGSTYAIEKVLYGINTKEPNLVQEPTGPSDYSDSRLGKVDRADTDFVSMQILFKDGTRSDIRIYKNDLQQ